MGSDQQMRIHFGCWGSPSARSVMPSHMLFGFRCGSGQLAELTDLRLEGSMAGTIPTEM
jgi:hypothetical protein